MAGAAIGNWVEWFDWYVYAAMALYFAPVFFPQGDSTAQLLNAAAVFAVGFLMRPLGGWVLGLYADRHGRKSALTLAIGMMSVGSLMIAVTPGVRALAWGDQSLFGVDRVTDAADWRLHAQLPGAAAGAAFDLQR